MQISRSTLILLLAVVGGGAFALGRETSPAEAPRTLPPRAEVAPEEESPPMEGHPGEVPGDMQDPVPDDEAPAIEWTVPPGWRTVPSPSSMRIATYAVPRSAGDAADADVSVTRAGGDVSSNIERWAGQFAGGGEPRRRVQTVHGFEVTLVEMDGTYTAGMQPGAQPRPGWALLGAIVKSTGQPYFFKMTGPAATVRATRAAFMTLVEGIRPAQR
jgi:hypothetical protein